MPILLASSNPHKVSEIRAIWDELSAAAGRATIDLITLDALDRAIDEPVEDQATFEGNALLKARHYGAATGMSCLADDSGLEVDALGGEPGVRSARFAGIEGGRAEVDPANNRLLIDRLGDTPIDNRTARFVCAMVLVAPANAPAGAEIVVRGTLEGRVLTRDEAGGDARGRGGNGFGYDPLFLVPSLGRTTAELDPAHKNRISHRGNAARAMWQWLCEAVGTARR